jgi:Flp pilus assembly protein TadG
MMRMGRLTPHTPATGRRAERGQTLAEFAIVLPMFLLLIFGVVECGRLFNAYITVQHSAREAARYAVTGNDSVVPGNRVESIRQVALEHLSPLGGSPTVSVSSRADVGTPSFTANSAGGPCDQVQVEVSHEFEFIFNFIGIGPTVDIEASERMISEQWDDCAT